MVKLIFKLMTVSFIIFATGCAANTIFCKRCGVDQTEAPVKNPLQQCPSCPVPSQSQFEK